MLYKLFFKSFLPKHDLLSFIKNVEHSLLIELLQVGIGLLVLQQLSGINGVLFYSTTIFANAGLDLPINCWIIFNFGWQFYWLGVGMCTKVRGGWVIGVQWSVGWREFLTFKYSKFLYMKYSMVWDVRYMLKIVSEWHKIRFISSLNLLSWFECPNDVFDWKESKDG